ncbi:hypothetical protein NL676_034154 [Syzygium grande]|nr:hypothetical protein NL676_034154 [Syzygium grande]
MVATMLAPWEGGLVHCFATMLAPWEGGLEYIARANRFSWLFTLRMRSGINSPAIRRYAEAVVKDHCTAVKLSHASFGVFALLMGYNNSSSRVTAIAYRASTALKFHFLNSSLFVGGVVLLPPMISHKSCAKTVVNDHCTCRTTPPTNDGELGKWNIKAGEALYFLAGSKTPPFQRWETYSHPMLSPSVCLTLAFLHTHKKHLLLL